MRASGKLQGFKIPGQRENLVATLFVDDTTVYLSEFDKLEDLQEITKMWCVASGAKFNIYKTRIIPCGMKKFRKNLLKTRKMNQNTNPVLKDLYIAIESEPVQTLGAWVGNRVDKVSIWTLTLDKILANLDR